MVTEHDALISSYSHEAQRPRAAEALHALQRIASLVKPIMRQRGWRVGTLAEFYPEQANLLGVNWNRGAKICLRLRYPADERQFLPLEQVVDTMLHELAHIVHGPHNRDFHALWDALRDEHEALLRKGYTGEGFLSKGQRLGGSGRVPIEEARRQARAAAAKRAAAAERARGSGQRLGGRPVRMDTDIREVIVSAIERRNTITKGCASGTEDSEAIVDQATRNGFKTEAEEDEANQRAIMQAYMELVMEEERERLGSDYIEPSAETPAGTRGATASAAEAEATAFTPPLQQQPPPPPPIPHATKPKAPAPEPVPSLEAGVFDLGEGWACSICTLFNQPNHLCCDACGTERPSSTLPLDVPEASALPAVGGRPSGVKRPSSTADERSASSASTGLPQPPAQPSPSSLSANKRPARRGAVGGAGGDAPTVLRPRGSRDAVDRIYRAVEAQKERPVGWLCSGCGNFMESEWWTCARCGRMKESSG